MANLFLTGRGSGSSYEIPTFTFRNRLRRFVWQFVEATLFRLSPRPFFRWRAILLRAFGAKIGHSNYIYPTALIWAPWLLETEAVVTIGPLAEIYNPGGIYLAHHSIVSQSAFLCGATHDINDSRFPMIWKPIKLEAYGWVCSRAIVLPGVVIGEGAVLGAGSVASKSLPAWTVWAGNPSRKVGDRTNHAVPERGISR